MEQSTGSKLGKEYVKVVILSPCLFNLYAEYITQNASLGDSWAGMKIARRNINNLRYADETTLIAESEETAEPLDESERGEWQIYTIYTALTYIHYHI